MSCVCRYLKRVSLYNYLIYQMCLKFTPLPMQTCKFAMDANKRGNKRAGWSAKLLRNLLFSSSFTQHPRKSSIQHQLLQIPVKIVESNSWFCDFLMETRESRETARLYITTSRDCPNTEFVHFSRNLHNQKGNVHVCQSAHMLYVIYGTVRTAKCKQ